MSVKFLNAEKNQLSFLDDSGATWTGIQCSVDGKGNITILGDGEIPNKAKAWLLNNTPSEFVVPPVSSTQIENERTRRLEMGFYYDFKDARGVHLFGTTEGDMVGWNDVSTVTQALIAAGQPSYVIDIVTNTGPTKVTAIEWQMIIITASAVRQPIWAASFAIQAMPEIPKDYASDVYWK